MCRIVFVFGTVSGSSLSLAMALTGTLVTLAASVLITGYLFYALNPVPADIEQGDDVFWIFAKRKYSRAMVSHLCQTMDCLNYTDPIVN